MKAERAVKHISFDRPEANPGETLYVSVQKLKENEVIKIGASLCYWLSGPFPLKQKPRKHGAWRNTEWRLMEDPLRRVDKKISGVAAENRLNEV